MDDKRAFEYFQLLEKQFWRKLNEATIKSITFEGYLKSADMLLYGEFGFTLLGLKPAMLVEFRDASINKLFYETVIQPTFSAMVSNHLSCHRLEKLTTPESNLDGCLLVYNNSHKDTVKPLISPETEEVSEETMASILDYPGSLPNSEEEIPTMQTVIYFHKLHTDKDLTALTSFAIQTREKPKTIEHFKKYHRVCKEKLDIDMKIFIE